MSADTVQPLAYVRHLSRFPKPRWVLGLDLGQRRDHSAVSVSELSWIERCQCKTDYSWLYEPQVILRGLERVPLGLTYEDIHEIVAEKVELLERRITAQTNVAAPPKELIIDAGGPGPPMVDRLRRSLRSVRITPVIITCGKGEITLTGGYIGIPRRSLVTRLLQMISCRTLRCPADLQGWDEFVAEFTELSGDSTQPAGGKSHDDLVMSTALAAWAIIRNVPQLKPRQTVESRTGAAATTCGFVGRPLF